MKQINKKKQKHTSKTSAKYNKMSANCSYLQNILKVVYIGLGKGKK